MMHHEAHVMHPILQTILSFHLEPKILLFVSFKYICLPSM